MIGILGGMGPYATLAFFKKVLDLSNVQKDSEHIHSWIDNNVKIPSRNRHFIYDEESPVDGMIESIHKMKKIGIYNLYIPCNSASYFIPEILNKVEDVNITGTIIPTVEYISNQYKNKKIMVLGAYIVYNKRPYKKLLEQDGFKYITHSNDIQKRIENLIYQIKTDNIEQKLVEEAFVLYNNIVKKYDIDLLVLGCTELCIVFDRLRKLDVEILDTNHILASYLVAKEQ